MLNRFNMFSPSLRELCAFSVDRGRRINGGCAGLRVGQRVEIHFELEGLPYVVGGAREGESWKKSSSWSAGRNGWT